jgi:hypothetical protein
MWAISFMKKLPRLDTPIATFLGKAERSIDPDI